MPHPIRLSLLALLWLLPAGQALGRWGADINPGEGSALVSGVRTELAAIVRATPADRPRLIEEFAARRGLDWVEGWKRFRNPELKDLFVKLLDHEDWHVVHRALYALEYFADTSIAARAWSLLKHPQRRMRERAAIACIKLWPGGAPPGDLEALLRREEDFHVLRCLEALRLRVQGKLKLERVSEEFRVTGADGLVETPFLSGMDQAPKVAPGYAAKPVARQGKGGADRLSPAARWCWPLLGWGEEEVAGVSLQPFANLRADGTVYHTGTDVGSCIEGAGFFAAAEGVVKLVHTGSDMGTLLVVEHNAGGTPACAVYMHGGDTVFVEAGDKVACGQLLGTMGMGFSIENGGHFAHLHFGLYPGAFSMTHNYGYKPVKAGLADWYDPAKTLPGWMERTRPLVADLHGVAKPLERAAALAAKGEIGRAHAEALAVRDGAEPGGEVHVDALYLLSELERAPENGVARAKAVLAAGHPSEALKELKECGARLKGLPGAEAIQQTLSAWEADPLVAKALKGESKVDAAERRAARLKDPAEAKAIFEALLKELGDTCLAARLQENLGR